MSNSLRGLVVVTIGLGVGGFGYWWAVGAQAPLQGQVESIDTETKNIAQNEPEQKETQTYRNDEFGFTFEYPDDWEVRIPAFLSKASLFNMAVEPNTKRNAEAVLVNITPKEWIEAALQKMRSRGVIITETELNGKIAFTAYTEEGFGGPSDNYYVLIDDSFWIHIAGQKRQEKIFREILASFKFLK